MPFYPFSCHLRVYQQRLCINKYWSYESSYVLSISYNYLPRSFTYDVTDKRIKYEGLCRNMVFNREQQHGYLIGLRGITDRISINCHFNSPQLIIKKVN